MRPRSRWRRLASLAAWPAAVALAAMGLAMPGCNPQREHLRPENVFSLIGKSSGQVIEPRRCALKVAILNRPFLDRVINDVVWKAADEQAITPEARRALEVNGLRIGQITGGLPPELESVLDAPPPHKVEPASFLLDDGEQTLISISEAVEQASLLMNRENRPYGKDYQSASGFFRVSVSQEGTSSVALRFTPEIHHGAVQRTFQPIAHSSPFSPSELRINDGQAEDTLRDLSVTLSLEPGQIAVVGCRPEQSRSLGTFLFSQAERHGDQRRQKLILVWAARNQLGALGQKPVKSDRPVASKELGPGAAGGRQPPGTSNSAREKPASRSSSTATAPSTQPTALH